MEDEIIKREREQAYRTHCDPLLMALLAAKELGEDENVISERRARWLDARECVDRTYPYPNEIS